MRRRRGRLSLDMLPLALLLTASSPALDLVDDVHEGCAPRLLDDRKYPFWEAQAACDAYLSLALVDEALDESDAAERRARAAAVDGLVDDLLTSRAQRPFRGTGFVTLAPSVKVPKSVLYRGYLMLMLSGLAKLDALTSERAALYDALAQSLVDDLAASKAGWLASFPNGIWPCDHALAAAGLVLHGTLRGSAASTTAGLALAARMDALRARGFPARVDAGGRVLDKDPRGTVLAWTAGFLGLAHVDEADRFATTLVDDMCGAPALPMAPFEPAACREWPRGSKRGEDAVSGPIVMGWGTGASALAIAATRINGKRDFAERLSATSSMTLALLGKKRGPLEDAILLWGSNARPWL